MLAPGQDKEIKHILFDEKSEELTFLKLFLKESSGILFHVNIV